MLIEFRFSRPHLSLYGQFHSKGDEVSKESLQPVWSDQKYQQLVVRLWVCVADAYSVVRLTVHQGSVSSLTLCCPADADGACENEDNSPTCPLLPSLLCSLREEPRRNKRTHERPYRVRLKIVEVLKIEQKCSSILSPKKYFGLYTTNLKTGGLLKLTNVVPVH